MVLAFVPVRIGSKSIPKKNIKLLNGHPLLYWSLRALSQSMTVDKIVFAHDSEEILDAVSHMPLERIEAYSRDPVNATDEASTESVMLEYIEKKGINDDDIFVLAQATSPLTTDRDVDAVVRMILDKGYDSALSCVRFKRFLWGRDGQSLNYDYLHRPRRQEFDGCMMENGALYASRVSIIRSIKCRIGGSIAIHEMNEDSATEIDEPSDWDIVDTILRRRLPQVSFFFSDVDGVLTDGGMYYGDDGRELKKYNTRDGMGFQILKSLGVKTGIITSESNKIVLNRADKLKVDFLFQGVKDKVTVMRDFLKSNGASFSDLAYIGDDINDKSLLAHAGISACPSDAVPEVMNFVRFKMTHAGGDGAVREFIEILLNGRYIKSVKENL